MALDEAKRAYHRAWKLKNKDRLLQKRRADYAARRPLFTAKEIARQKRDPKTHKASTIAKGIVARSYHAGWPRPEWVSTAAVLEWLNRQPECECCSVSFYYGVRGEGWRNDSPSFDRFDPTGDYSLSNVRLICWRCNNIKRDYGADDLMRVARWILRG